MSTGSLYYYSLGTLNKEICISYLSYFTQSMSFITIVAICPNYEKSVKFFLQISLTWLGEAASFLKGPFPPFYFFNKRTPSFSRTDGCLATSIAAVGLQ